MVLHVFRVGGMENKPDKVTIHKLPPQRDETHGLKSLLKAMYMRL